MTDRGIRVCRVHRKAIGRARRARMLLVGIAQIGLLAFTPAHAQTTPPDHGIQLQQQRLRRNPYDAAAYYRLGDVYIQKARETGDMSYFALAERALLKSLEMAPQSAGAVRHLAYVSSSRHDFEQALGRARQALALDPSDADALGVEGDALLELGRYDEADAAYRRMMQITRNLASYSRRSGLEYLRGDPEGSLADLQRAIDAGVAEDQPRESIAWAQWQLGAERFAGGDVDGAETSYREALATYPGYHRPLAGLGQVRAAQGRYTEAADFYRKALAVIPLPEYATALGDVYTKMGRAVDARQQYRLVEYIARLSTLNRVLYNRELVYFYADHGLEATEALDLARREIEIRKDVYGYDALAWALYANGSIAEAAATMNQALRLGTREARLFFHAGMIYYRLGRQALAIQYLERALATNPSFHVLQADVARAALRLLRSSAPGMRTEDRDD